MPADVSNPLGSAMSAEDTSFIANLGVSQTDELQAAMPLVYDELRRLAAGYLRGERPNHTLQPTALVHEAYLWLLDQHKIDFHNHAQFLGIAARMMRRILTNHALARGAAKRGEGAVHLSLDEALDFYDRRDISLTAVDEALRELQALDPLQAQVVELRFFGGLTVEEVAKALEISVAKVKREWATAKLWLKLQLSDGA